MIIMKLLERQNKLNDEVYNFTLRKYKSSTCMQILLALNLLILTTAVVKAAPHAATDKTMSITVNRAIWPPMKHHNIWNNDKEHLRNKNERGTLDEDNDETLEFTKQKNYDNFNFSAWQLLNNLMINEIEENVAHVFGNLDNDSKRKSKVIHLFPVPVDGECLSSDGRRTGTCFNVYECHNKGGEAKGECALGFGVCCIFIANCNETIGNNITYLVSPNFPSFMPNNITNCIWKIKLMNNDISQLRIDFYHFILGQPNRRTGVCDGDVFSVSGGPGGTIPLCGQNSGQHIYYDVGGRMLPRQTLYGTLKPLRYEDLYSRRNKTNETNTEIDIKLNFAPRFLPTRLWEIRISQIPFSQRAPAGCLQYFTGRAGVFQTFNFADNGRHLANQDYRICMRQEVDMCSILYQPCDEQSFRIGPSDYETLSSVNDQFHGSTGIPGTNENNGFVNGGDGMEQINSPQMQILSNESGNAQTGVTTVTILPTSSAAEEIVTTTPLSTTTNQVASNMTENPTIASELSTAFSPQNDVDDSSQAIPSTPNPTTSTASNLATPLNDDADGSGDDDDSTRFRPTASVGGVSKRPQPTRGGFDLLGLLRSAFQFGYRSNREISPLVERQMRHFYSNCRDRITMPCIIEDFIGTGLGPLPGCEPVHCGMQFCSSGIWPCRIESTVTPFYVGVHFGDGSGKGSPEDNIGVCLRYQQLQCM